jgi:hypothetical protein
MTTKSSFENIGSDRFQFEYMKLIHQTQHNEN